MEKEWAAEGYIPSHERTGSRGYVEILTVKGPKTWHPRLFHGCGSRNVRWRKTATWVLSFGGREIVLHGLNLRELWDRLDVRDLLKVRELPADYVPPPTLRPHRVCIFKIELRDTAGHCASSPASEPSKRSEYQMNDTRGCAP